jgi:hypothetical protein
MEEHDVFFDDFALEDMTVSDKPQNSNANSNITASYSHSSSSRETSSIAAGGLATTLSGSTIGYNRNPLSLYSEESFDSQQQNPHLITPFALAGGLRRTQTHSPLPIDSFEYVAASQQDSPTTGAVPSNHVQGRVFTTGNEHVLSTSTGLGRSATRPISMPSRATLNTTVHASPLAGNSIPMAASPGLAYAHSFHAAYAQQHHPSPYTTSPGSPQDAHSPTFPYAPASHIANLYSQSLPMSQRLLVHRSSSEIGSPSFSTSQIGSPNFLASQIGSLHFTDMATAHISDMTASYSGDLDALKSPSSSQSSLQPLDKKERNRLAAERCRKKKAELIHQLSLENQLLRYDNTDLAKANLLLEQKLDYLISILASYGISMPK